VSEPFKDCYEEGDTFHPYMSYSCEEGWDLLVTHFNLIFQTHPGEHREMYLREQPMAHLGYIVKIEPENETFTLYWDSTFDHNLVPLVFSYLAQPLWVGYSHLNKDGAWFWET